MCLGWGGGPAGLAAARTAARHGVRVTLVDDNAELGGQYYRQLPAAFPGTVEARPVREQAEGRRLMDEVRSLGVEVMAGSVAWGIFDQRTVAVATQDETRRIVADTVVLAPGAYDRPVPFPGWTLPGVLTAGGAQNLMKGYRVLTGRRFTRYTARASEPRGYFCGMGVCHDCLVTVEGLPNVRACLTPVRDGLRVETQRGLGEWGGLS